MSRDLNEEDLPPLPRVKLDDLEDVCDELQRIMSLFPYVGERLQPAHITDAVERLQPLIYPYVETQILRDTLAQYLGERLTPALAQMLAYQLSARTDDLKSGPLLRTAHPTGCGWHVVELDQMVPEVQYEKSGYQLTLHVRYGQLAGHSLNYWASQGFLSYLAYRALGFTRGLLYDDEPWTLLYLRAWVLIGREEEQLQFRNWCGSKDVDKRNKRIIRLRMREGVDTTRMSDKRAAQYACPYDLDHYCSECPKTTRMCAAAVHREARSPS